MSGKFEGIWHIQDLKHRKNIVAGTIYDGHVYHQAQDGRPEGVWTKEWIDERAGTFFLRDLRHGKYLYGGDGTSDAPATDRLYNANSDSIIKGGLYPPSAVWRQVPIPNTGRYYLQAQGGSKGAVAGDIYDENIYYQDPGGRDNAKWSFETASTSSIRFPMARLPLSKGKTIAYKIDTANLTYGWFQLNSQAVSEAIANAWVAWIDVLNWFGLNIKAVEDQTISNPDVKFSWGAVDKINNVAYTRAAVTNSSGGGSWMDATGTLNVIFNKDCTWDNLGQQANLPKPLLPTKLIEELIKNIVYAAEQTADLLSVAVHEIGHVLGLDHAGPYDRSLLSGTATTWGTYFFVKGNAIPVDDKARLQMRYLDVIGY